MVVFDTISRVEQRGVKQVYAVARLLLVVHP